jgi:PAS domain S-box-containing protein
VEVHLTIARMKTQLESATWELDAARRASERLNADLEGQIRRRTAELEDANKALREIKTQFEAVYNHHYQLTGLIDKEGRLLMGNRTALELAGIQARDVVGKRFWETPWWTHSQEAQRMLREAMGRAMRGEMVHFETTHISATGETRHIDFRIGPVFDDNGEVIYLVPEGYDITERKQAEVALRESEEKYRTFFENSYDAMLMLKNGLVVDCNAAAVAALGYKDAKDLLNTHPSEFSPEHQPDGKKSYAKALEMMEIAYARGTHRFEWEHSARNGDAFPVEISLTAIPSDGERRLIAVWRDIADRKWAEEQRVRLETQLHQAQKMESLGRLAGGIAHDFNNILVPIIGYVELGMMNLSPENELYTDLKRVREAANKATDLTRQILAFSRKQVLEMRVLDLNTVVTDFENMMQRLIGEDIELQTFLDPTLYRIKADKGQIEQVLLNLVVNARDAMPMGGKLTIETANIYLDETYVKKYVNAQPPGHYALLAVSDTGHGMDAETQQQIFEPFFTTKAQGEGTGLGLATVFGIVKQHGGNILVYSEPGKGATFKIYLPQAEGTVQTPDTTVTESASIYGTETVLVVEDEEMVRKLVCETLETYGYEVIEAQSPNDGLQLASAEDKIHLLLTDVIMPEMNGRELYQKVAAAQPGIRVLYMSGYTDNVIVHHGMLDEGVNFLQKPFTVHNLIRKIRQVLS